MATTKTTTRKPRKRLTDEEREQRIAELKDTLNAAVLGLNSDSAWVEFLTSTAAFGARYSWGNQLLILTQAQARGFNPTMVLPFGSRDRATGAGKSGWLKLGRQVRKGEKGLQIWAPVRSPLTDEEVAKYQAEGKRTHTADGRRIKVLRTFRIEHVFDLAQTDGDPVEVPEPVVHTIRRRTAAPKAQLLTGEDTTGALGHVIQLILDRGWTYQRAPREDLGSANGDTNATTKVIRVRDDVSDAHAVKTTVHELAHAILGHAEDMAEYRRHRGRMETEAESVAYIVCGALGLDTGAYSAPYVSSWSDGDAEVLERTAATVVRTARQILEELEKAGSGDGDQGEGDQDGSEDLAVVGEVSAA